MAPELAYKVKGYRFNLQNAGFRYYPKPQDDELMSSWLVRVAFAHMSDPATFINLYLPQYREKLWYKDIDVSADNSLLHTIADKCGFAFETVFNMTLRSYEGYLFEKIFNKSSNPFIQEIRTRAGIKTKGGLRFCPKCLKEDAIPYFRKKWRLSFSTACLKHNCFMLDKCPSCGAALTIYRHYHENNIPHCHKCGFYYKDASSQIVDEGSYGLVAIRKLYEILDCGFYRHRGGYAYSFHFFVILKQLVKVIYSMKKRIGFLDHEVMTRFVSFKCDKPKIFFLDDIPLKMQYLLFSEVMRLLEKSPGRLLSFCASNNLRMCDLTSDLAYMPFWFKAITDKISKVPYIVTIEEVGSIIEYLKKKGEIPYKATVAKMIEGFFDLRKRPDIRERFFRK